MVTPDVLCNLSQIGHCYAPSVLRTQASLNGTFGPAGIGQLFELFEYATGCFRQGSAACPGLVSELAHVAV